MQTQPCHLQNILLSSKFLIMWFIYFLLNIFSTRKYSTVPPSRHPQGKFLQNTKEYLANTTLDINRATCKTSFRRANSSKIQKNILANAIGIGCNLEFFALFSSRDVEWGYFLAICRIELSNSATLHIVKLHDFWSFGRVCLISHSGLLKKNKPDSIPIGILPTYFMKYIQGLPIIRIIYINIPNEWNYSLRDMFKSFQFVTNNSQSLEDTQVEYISQKYT